MYEYVEWLKEQAHLYRIDGDVGGELQSGDAPEPSGPHAEVETDDDLDGLDELPEELEPVHDEHRAGKV